MTQPSKKNVPPSDLIWGIRPAKIVLEIEYDSRQFSRAELKRLTERMLATCCVRCFAVRDATETTNPTIGTPG